MDESEITRRVHNLFNPQASKEKQTREIIIRYLITIMTAMRIGDERLRWEGQEALRLASLLHSDAYLWIMDELENLAARTLQ